MANTQAIDVMQAIELLGPITAEDIAIRTEWNRHVVDVTINALINEGWIYQSGTTQEYGDPLYLSTFKQSKERAR
jgi:hypothetical protein